MSRVYYNEIDPYCAAWLRNLMDAGHIPAGDIDTRSIEDVRPDELRGYMQCHFFAGIGGWPLALALAGWPAGRPVWTGSCPCQPFSAAGKGAGFADQRHLWPAWFHLIRECRPPVIFGEQVAAAVGHAWLDGVCADLEGQGYAIGAAVLPACSVDAPHKRDRLWFVGDSNRVGEDSQYGALARSKPDPARGGSTVADASMQRCTGRENAAGGDDDDRTKAGWRQGTDRTELYGQSTVAYTEHDRREGRNAQRIWPGAALPPGQGNVADPDYNGCNSGRRNDSSIGYGNTTPPAGYAIGHWASAGVVIGHDGKARRVEPSIRLLAHGIPGRVGRLRAYGNAIVPQVAAEFIGAYAEARGVMADCCEVAA